MPGNGVRRSSAPANYGDVWRYVAALHQDTDHLHAHFVVDKHGIEQGRFMSICRYSELTLEVIPEGESAQSFFNAGKRLFIASCLYAIEQRRPTLGYAAEIMAGGGDKKKSFTTIAETTNIPIVSRTFLEMADVAGEDASAPMSRSSRARASNSGTTRRWTG